MISASTVQAVFAPVLGDVYALADKPSLHPSQRLTLP
jgi:hypothetical protein